MTFTPIAKGTPNWDVPLNTALTQLDNNTNSVATASLKASNNLSDLTNVNAARANLNLTGLANALSNMSATTNPTVSSDQTQGYSIGSTWFNTTTQTIFVAASVATGAAVWNQIPSNPVTIAQGGTGSTTQNFVDISTGQTIAGLKNFTGSPTFNNITTGVWITYTPTWTAVTTAPTIGNGTLTGSYALIGKTCHFRINMNSGTTTTYGSGLYTFTLPFTAGSAAGVVVNGVGHASAGAIRAPISGQYGSSANTLTPWGPTSATATTVTQLGSTGVAGTAWTAATANQFVRLSGTFETA